MDNTVTAISPGASMFYESTFKNALEALLWLFICAVGLSYAPTTMAQDSPAVALMSENGEGSSWETAALEADRRDAYYVALSQLAQAPGALSRPVTLRLRDATLDEALRHVSEETGLEFVYGKQVASGGRVSVDLESVPAKEALQEILRGTGRELMLSSGGQLILVSQADATGLPKLRARSADFKVRPVAVQAAELMPVVPKKRQGTISGTVTDSLSGEPIPGVNVVIAGTQQGSATDAEGQYTISGVEVGTYTLRASFVGYSAKAVEGVEVQEGQTTEVDFQLVESAVALDEIVAIGYGEQRRRDLTGSVSSVEGEDLSGTPYSNVEQSLQGKLSGVNVTPYSGEPGASMEVQVRGVGTFGSTEPLYIVDGVPMQGQDMSSINQDDIESIEVLKDASAAAIYGARAANGVVLITTRGGEIGAPQIEYSGYVGVQSFTDHIPLLNSVEYAELVNETTEEAGLPYESAFYPADPSENENLQHNTDWQEEALRVAPVTKQNLSVSGGTEDVRYLVSGGYFGQEGVMVFNNFQRYSLRVNTEYKPHDKITIGENMSFSRSERLNGGQGNNLDFSYMLGASPTMRLYKPENEGGYGGPYGPETGVNNRANVIGRRDMRRNWNDQNRLFGNVYAEYEIIPNLQYRLNFGLDARWDQSESFIRTYDMDNRQVRQASMSQTKSDAYDLLLENTLNYSADISENYNINLLAGYTQENSTYEYVSGSINNFASNDIRALSAGKGTPSLGGNKSEWALRSFVGRANLRLYDRYLLTSTFRRDGSSRFGQENRWGNFPSFALGWIISEEEFMSDVNFINQLKLRGSWGQIGNQEISNYVNQTTVSTEVRYVFNDNIVSGAAVTELGNPQLKWETTTQTDIGVDMEVMNSRLSLHADYFIKNTEGILLRVPISVATGIDRSSGPYRNAASLRNSGFELEASWRDGFDDLFYSISANVSTIRNEVTSLGGESSIINYVADVYPDYGAFTITRVGDPLSSFYGWVADGIFQSQEEIDNHARQDGAQPGDVRFRDLDGNGVINDADRKIIGNPFPDFTYGLNVTAEYRSFDLGFTIQGVQGRELYPAQRVFLESMNGEHNQMETTLDRWRPDNPSESMPRATRNDPNQNVRPSTRFIEDASYIRLNNLEVGYAMPSSLISRIGLERLRVSLRGQNLITIDGYSMYNPDTRGGDGFSEIGGDPLAIGVDVGAYPIPRSFQLGIQAGF